MGSNNFAYGFGLLQICFGVLFAIFVRYNEDETKLKAAHNMDHYSLFQNINTMIFIGFGYLMTFLGKNGFTAVGHTMMVSCVAVEAWILFGNFFNQLFDKDDSARWNKIELDVAQLIQGLFAAAAVLISFGALIGRVSMAQLTFLAVVEVIVYSLNSAIYNKYLTAVDVGGSVILHAFGAYFGLTAAMVLNRGEAAEKDQSNNSSNIISDLFSLVGTVFLFMYWPSFTAGAVPVDTPDQNRVFVNTFIGISASVIATYVVSPIVIGDKRTSHINVVQLQNATLAGGVSIGTACAFKIQPAGAILIGSIAGTVSTIGYQYIQPALQNKIGLLDSCGVHNLHGMPGLLGGLAAIIAVAAGAADGTATVFATRDGTPRSNSEQAGIQFAGLIVTILFAMVSGGLAGFVASKFNTLSEFYHDIAEYNNGYYPTDESSVEAEQPAQPSNASENMVSKQQQRDGNYGTINDGDQSVTPLIGH